MKKILLLLIATFTIVVSCKKEVDPIKQAEIERQADSIVDASIKKITKEIHTDSTGMKNSPVVVLKSRLVKEEYSNYRNIELKYKNVSNKKIIGIKFEWYGETAFGEPADMGGSFTEGTGGGFTDETLRPNSVGYGTWNIYSGNAKKIIMARASEVAFEDGTKWKLN